LVIAQVGLALMFLVAAGLTIQSLRRTLSIPLGYAPHGLLSVRVTLDPVRAASDSNATLWRSILDELRVLPGVSQVASGSCSPLGMHCDGTTITPVGRAPGRVSYLTASPDYFATLQTPILRGRSFTDEEMSGRRRAVIINQSAARSLWGSDDPLTTPIQIDTTSIDVVGVVADARYGVVERPAYPAVFFPHRDSRGVILLRTARDPSSLVGAVRGAIRRAGSGHATSDARTMDSRLRDATARNRLSLQVFTSFAISALLLAAIGVYGTLSLRVTLRARELAIRRALGASTASLVATVGGQTARISLAGAAVGIGGAALVARTMSSLLYGVTALEPIVYAAATALLLTAICVAAAVPTARTLRTDPREAMRAD
jgi:putative ABC transport system permease protein